MKEPKDKTSKAWKKWNGNQNLDALIAKGTPFNPKGLEDYIEDFKESTLFNKNQLKEWKAFKERENENIINKPEQELIIKLSREILGASIMANSTCPKEAWKVWISKIDSVYETHRQN